MARDNTLTDKPAVKSLNRRSVGFHEFLDIGAGRNMYYSTWAGRRTSRP